MKNMKKILLYSIIAIIFSSCANPLLKNITKQLPPLEDNAEVIVYDRGDTVPENAEILGGIAFTCNTEWKNMLEIAKKEARAAGGNGLEIQVRVNRYPSESPNKAHMLSAFILNVNDSIKPSQPTPFEKKEFQDYVVIKEGDTIPCSIVFESKSHLQFVYDYERHGNRKALSLPKQDLTSYHIGDSIAFNKIQQRRRLFNGQIAIDGGYSFPSNFSIAANARFVRKNAFSSYGIHYDYSSTFNSHVLAGSLGFISAYPKQKTRDQILESYLDGAVGSPEYHKRHRFYFDFLYGFYYSRVDAKYWTNTNWINTYNGWGISNGGYWHIKDAAGIGIGLDMGYDFMLTEHLGIGLALYEFVGIPLIGTVNGEVEFSNSQLKPFGSLELNVGLRYYY